MDFFRSKIKRDQERAACKKATIDKENKRQQLVTTLIDIVTSNKTRSNTSFLDIQQHGSIQTRFIGAYLTVYDCWESDNITSKEGMERFAIELYEELINLSNSGMAVTQLKNHCLQHFAHVSGNSQSFYSQQEISPEEFKYLPSRMIFGEDAQPKGNRTRSLSVVDEKDLEDRGYKLSPSSGVRSSSYS
ncbi:MAG: hypothetical protein Q8R83_04935 [Legionellaceae bacterium]|nr:hypothetical protein [Legionellaceae bacterium]